MTPQDHANHLLAVWQQRRVQGVKPELRLEQDNRSEQEWEDELRLIDWQVSQAAE